MRRNLLVTLMTWVVILLCSSSGFSQTCPLLTHNPFTDFNSTPNPQTPTTLWVHIETKLANTNLTSNGDFLLFTGGAVTLTGITSTPMVSNVAIPDGKIIADNTVSQPVTSFDLISNTWITRVPPGYSSSDIFISAAIINSSTGFIAGAGKSSTVTGHFVSNKPSFKQAWIYGLATFRPEFSYSDVAGPGQVASVGGGIQAATPIPEKAGLVAGGSGGGGSNFTGSNSSTDTYNTCQKICNLSNSVFTFNSLCNGDVSGYAIVTLTGGTPPFTYTYPPTGGTYVTDNTVTPFYKLTAGPYSWVVTDSMGCTTDVSVTITQPPVLQVTGLVVNATNTSNGSITVNVAGGTPPYGFAWSTGAITEDLTNLSAGTYSLTVTDAHGCTAGLTELLTGQVCNSLNVSATVVRGDFDNSCDGEATINVTGGTGPYSYSWSDGVTTSTNTRSDLCGPLAGSGTPVQYTVVVTDANGCSGNTSFLIDVTSNAPSTQSTLAVSANARLDQIPGTTIVNAYPNPSKGLVHLLIGSKENASAVMTVTDMSGRVVRTFQINLQQGINSNDLQLPIHAAGIYVLQIKTSKEIRTLRLLLN